ncbi:hypothetical protein [Microbacterium gorillae]|uniref:hypothetical protein n=1 Tax=Microbacterium gorillae TaxID=1231063 RepID=UPI0005915280|nr:hypothetical protein [Microbacterium gorillae]
MTLYADDFSRSVSVTAALIVADNVTEVTAHMDITAGGIEHASGNTGSIVSLGDYAIISPAAAAVRLADPAFPLRQTAWPESDESMGVPDVAPTAPAPVPAAGSAVPWSILEREIVAVRLELTLVVSSDGVTYLAPAYEFTTSDGTSWGVIALEETDLDTSIHR